MGISRLTTLAVLLLGAAAHGQPQAAPPNEPGQAAQTEPPPQEITDMARKFYESGVSAYEKGDFPTALRAFEAAWATLPQAEFQFNIARCNERLGRWGLAATAYQQYLRTKQNPPDADEIRMRVAELFMREREAEAARAIVRPAPPPAKPRRTLRIAALALLGGAVALGGAGTGAYLSEWSDYQSRRDACAGHCSPAELDGLRTRVEVAQAAGGILWGVAGAALVADLVLWIVDARSKHEPTVAARGVGWRF